MDEAAELRKMTTAELIAYHNILVMSSRMLQVTDDPGRNDRHLKIVNGYLGLPDYNADLLIPTAACPVACKAR